MVCYITILFLNLMVQLIRMRPWYMPMMSPFDKDMDEDAVSTGINVYEKEGVVHIEAPVPGIPADKVEVTYSEGQLHIRAKHEEKEEEKDKKKVVYKMERDMSFEYTTTIPTAIDDKTMEAEVKDGIVYVSAKVAEAAKPKKITVKTGN